MDSVSHPDDLDKLLAHLVVMNFHAVASEGGCSVLAEYAKEKSRKVVSAFLINPAPAARDDIMRCGIPVRIANSMDDFAIASEVISGFGKE